MDAPLNFERFIANLALGYEIPGPGIRIATAGAIRGRRTKMRTTRVVPDEVAPSRQERGRETEGELVLTDVEAKNWLGFQLELFGTPLPDPFPKGPTFPLYDEKLDMTLEVRLWRQWARHEDSPLRAERLWMPVGHERYSIRFPEPVTLYSRPMRDDAFRGLVLLQRHSLLPAIARSKPGPKADLSPEELEAAVLAAISSEWKRLRRKPNLKHLALYFSEHLTLPQQTDTSLGERIRRAELDLADLYRRGKPSA
jgi:hypothetical protein